MVEKYHISAEELLEDSFKLGVQILESGFRPSYIVGIWRGGSPPGIAVQELLDFFDVSADHIAIRTSAYTGIDERSATVRVHGLHYIIENVNAEDSLLIVDDVFDSGSSIAATIEHIHRLCRRNAPHDIRVATVYYKPRKNITTRVPDYFVHETDKWLVFPHELAGLSEEDIEQKKSGGNVVLKTIRARRDGR